MKMNKKIAKVILTLAVAATVLSPLTAKAKASKAATRVVVDHDGDKVTIPAVVNRVAVVSIWPLPSVITVFLNGTDKLVGIPPASMGAAKAGLLGQLYPSILKLPTNYTNGEDVNVEELLKLNPDVVFCSSRDPKMKQTLQAAGLTAVAFSVNKWNYDILATYDGWIDLSDTKEVVFSRDTYVAKLTVVPDEKDKARTGKATVEAQTSIMTGILMQEIIPDKEWKIVVNTIYFDPDAATFNKITEAQRQSNKDTLDSIARQLEGHSDCTIAVEGYANNVTNTEKENIEELIPLSQARAEAIVRQLVERGIAKNMLSAKGFGGANPLAAWEDHDNWWKNRRVEFRVTKQ